MMTFGTEHGAAKICLRHDMRHPSLRHKAGIVFLSEGQRHFDTRRTFDEQYGAHLGDRARGHR
jgi:hypothetical protein